MVISDEKVSKNLSHLEEPHQNLFLFDNNRISRNVNRREVILDPSTSLNLVEKENNCC